MRAAALEFTRVDGVAAHRRRRIFELVRANAFAEPRARCRRRPRSAARERLPELRLDHLLRMTDDTGIIQHATYSVPARSTGYCVDDNARALIVAVHADRVQRLARDARARHRVPELSARSQETDGVFRNFMSYDPCFEPALASDDCIGRALWALGVTGHARARTKAAGARPRHVRARAAVRTRARAARHGAGDARAREPAGRAAGAWPPRGATCSIAWSRACASRIATKPPRIGAGSKPTLTYDNAILPLALFAAYAMTGDRTRCASRASRSSSSRTCASTAIACSSSATPAGTAAAGRRPRRTSRPSTRPPSCSRSAARTRSRTITHYLRRMRESFAWFLGANRLGVPLYDFATGGCRDGMGVAQVNQNQGAESTICFLLSLLEMLELAGEELEHADRIRRAASSHATDTITRTHHRLLPMRAACSPSRTFPARRSLAARRVARGSADGSASWRFPRPRS